MVIVGAGHTGGRAAEALRREGWSGQITLIGAEPVAPYERPPLSKEFLTGAKGLADCAVLDDSFYSQPGITLRTGTEVAAVRRARQEVILGDGDAIPYERLLLATGAVPRRLDMPGNGLDGVCYLRDASDAEALKARLGLGRRVVIIGGGFIGLEVAAAAVELGGEVVVVEVGPRLMGRGVPAPVEARMRARHASAGVDVRLGRRVDAIHGDCQVTGVRLDDGSDVSCDTVLVAVGVAPRVDLAQEAGLAVDNGIAVGSTLVTEDPLIFAAGDVCSFENPTFGRRIRLESWSNAEEQGRLVARNMLGGTEECGTVPWMWSDQYEMTIQVAGLPDLGSQTVERGLAPDAAIYFHLLDDGRIIGASSAGPNATISRTVKLAQMMIQRGIRPDPARLADAEVDLKVLLRERQAPADAAAGS